MKVNDRVTIGPVLLTILNKYPTVSVALDLDEPIYLIGLLPGGLAVVSNHKKPSEVFGEENVRYLASATLSTNALTVVPDAEGLTEELYNLLDLDASASPVAAISAVQALLVANHAAGYKAIQLVDEITKITGDSYDN